MRCFALLIWADYFVRGDYFPPVKSWVPPRFLPWDPMRATTNSILVSWEFAWNPTATLGAYELQIRSPEGDASAFSLLLDLRHRSQENPRWDQMAPWGPWTQIYIGHARVFKITNLRPGYPYGVRVRCTGERGTDGMSPWSETQIVHTVWPPTLDRFPVYILGGGRNNPQNVTIQVDETIIYRDMFERGLVLAVFQRRDFSLVLLKTYDTFQSDEEADKMAKALRSIDSSHFVFVASIDAWELHVTSNLQRAMEFCGAYQFGQWVDIFQAPTTTKYRETSIGDFGHPYAFIGIPGLSAGMGWESMQLPTGHYLTAGKAPPAEIRMVMYFDYVDRHYYVSLPTVSVAESDFFVKGSPPPFGESVHNPVSGEEHAAKCEAPNCNMWTPGVKTLLQPAPPYTPYIGTLRFHFDRIREANETEPPDYFGFHIITKAKKRNLDPRPVHLLHTELDYVWGGSSARWETDDLTHVVTNIVQGIELDQRPCREWIYDGIFESNPFLCANPHLFSNLVTKFHKVLEQVHHTTLTTEEVLDT
eukprot:GEMP01030251.1.p1 GENE.GEMP01030251.1~~GEMP01030251.1.p1  ORF type:complete len:532 (+),score=99.68 GEMP01030251.1:44-1639(+)